MARPHYGRFWWFIFLTFLSIFYCSALVDQNRQIEQSILKDYNKRHRPVKSDSKQMTIPVFLMINHVEKVDELEQTMLLHGLLWATWEDEYLKWEPSKFNNTNMISIESWKIWQPSFALYNSAKSNGWYLHMQGVPATVTSLGKVYSSGSFSFHVTCLFDYTDYPYDIQECPIVIADWIYDLSKVNLSNPLKSDSKPIIRLTFDPIRNESKKHVAGWEVWDAWHEHCYWGTQGCQTTTPDSLLDHYWSLLEFGIKLRRHAPYYGLTIVMPTIITASLTLLVFWFDDYSLAIALTIFNILLQGLFGWALVKDLPPGNGSLPKIAHLYALNLALTALAFIIHSVFNYLLYILPHDIEFPFQLTNITEKLRAVKFFQVEGFSFDPQKFLLDRASSSDNIASMESPTSNSVDHLNFNPTVTPSNTAIEMEPTSSHEEENNIIELEQKPYKITEKKSNGENHYESWNSNSTKTDEKKSAEEKAVKNNIERSHLEEEFYTLRRIIFFFYLIIFVVVVPYCLF